LKQAAKPSELELQVLGVLWDHGPATAREVLEALPDGKPRAYTTVLTVLQVMEKKGLVRHTSRGKAHVYHPRVKRQAVVGDMLRGLVHHAFGGRSSDVVQCLLDSESVNAEDLAEIRRLIREHDRRPKEEGGAS